MGFDEQAKVAGSIIKRAEIEAETPGFKTPQSPTEYLAAIRAVVLPIDPLVAVKMAGALAEAVLDEIAMPHIPKENGWAGSSEPIEAARRGGVISPVGVLAFHKLRELRYVLLDNTTKKVVPEEATEYLDLVSDALSLVERQYAIALARSMS